MIKTPGDFEEVATSVPYINSFGVGKLDLSVTLEADSTEEAMATVKGSTYELTWDGDADTSLVDYGVGEFSIALEVPLDEG